MSGLVRVVEGDLKGLDNLRVDALALLFYAVYAQPQEVPGFVDWRLAGALGRLIKRRRFRGQAGEALLMPSAGGVGAQRIFLLGLGAPEQPKESFLRHLKQAAVVLRDAGVRAVAMAPPNVPPGASPSVERRAFAFAVGALEAIQEAGGQL